MRDLHHVSFAAFAAGKNNAAGANGLYRSAHLRAVIGAHVRAHLPQIKSALRRR
jgi:hypothetical protein